jgi:hypothetical protein
LIESLSSTEVFAQRVVAYQEWLLHGTSEGQLAAKEALEHLLALYSAALLIPFPKNLSAKSHDLPENAEDANPSLRFKSERIPLDFYGELFDPLIVPPAEPVVGFILDDLMDIHRDLIRGLRYFEVGRCDEALWEWRFSLRHHWGEHATSAIRALHCWLAANSDAFFYV